MFRHVFWGFLIVTAMTSVASADHKPGHSPGGGGGGGATLGDLNCTTNQIAKFNGITGAWECEPDAIGGDSFVVVDDDNQIIRHTTIDDNLRSAFVAVDVQFFGETATILHQVDQNGTVGEILYFESSDCSTLPYVSPWIQINPPPAPTPESSMLPNWKESVLISDPFTPFSPNPDERLVFFIDYSQIVTGVVMNSYFDSFTGVCSTTSNSRAFSIPVTEGQFSDARDDLNVLFPSPYRICAVDDFNCIDGP